MKTYLENKMGGVGTELGEVIMSQEHWKVANSRTQTSCRALKQNKNNQNSRFSTE